MQYEVVCGKMAGKYLEDSQRFWAVGDVNMKASMDYGRRRAVYLAQPL